MSFLTVKAPHILLPIEGTDMNKYSIIACDQFTSEIEYWNEIDRLVQDNLSTYHMIFPEAYLGKVNEKQYIGKINENIKRYISTNSLVDIGESIILVERVTSYGVRRLGLVLAIDLEDYCYHRGFKCPIKASEATIIERIPPRLKIRRDAEIELPHTLLLYCDEEKKIIEPLFKKRNSLECLYNFELNQNGGHIKGYRVDDKDKVIEDFKELLEKNQNDLLFVVGDGNHSLATAKAHWEEIKLTLKEEEKLTHPARFALVEVNNVYDEGINFEPIHRIIFNVDDDFAIGLKHILKGNKQTFIYSKKEGKISINIPKNGAETYQIVQNYIDLYLKSHSKSRVDYIHDEESLFSIADNDETSFAIVMPGLGKSDIFDFVARDETLPRKSFSMGHASEKRYYLEAKMIK